MNHVASSSGHVFRRTASTNDESHIGIRQLRMRPIGHRFRLPVKRHVLAVGNDTDNFVWHVLIFHVDGHSFADWVFAGQILARKCFIDDHDVTLISGLLRSEQATLLERDLHRIKIVRIGYTNAGGKLLTWRKFRLTLNIDSGPGVWAIEWQKADGSHAFYVRQSLHLADCLFEKIDGLAISVILP